MCFKAINGLKKDTQDSRSVSAIRKDTTMREIQNNTGVPFAPKVELAKKETVQTPETKPENDVKKPVGTEDLSKSPEAVIGRSQINKKNPIEQMKAVEGDVKAMMENPEEVERINKFFDLAYSFTGNYEKSAEMTEAFRQEFLSK